ncbi:MAG: signal peptidase I [Ghiorsea sp.]
MANSMESLKKSTGSTAEKPQWREWIESIVVIVLLAVVIRSFVIAPFKIPSSSMVPTFEVGDYLFVSRFNYGFRIPFTDLQFMASEATRGDVVVFDYPEDRSKDYIKRIVGVPGDVIVYENNELSVNGEKMVLKEEGVHSYFMGNNSVDISGLFSEQLTGVEHKVLRKNFSIRDGKWKVPAGKYFVLGDNRNNSRDSRFWGFVPHEFLVGKAVVIWWSWNGGTNTVRWDRLGTLIK